MPKTGWLESLDHGVIGMALGLIGTSGALAVLPDTATPVLRLILAVLWLGLWFLCAGALLIQPWRIAQQHAWHRLWPLVVTLLLFLHAAVRLGTSSFAVDDELTSWNYWAIQHFLGQSADYSFTQAAYPQLFAAWVSAVYRVMGGFDLQSVARLTVALTTLLLGLLMMKAGELGGRRGSWLAALLLLLFWFDGFWLSFTRGLADPLMVLALLASIHYFLCYAANPRRSVAFWCAALAAVVASFTKQPALIWGCLGLPLFCAWCVWRRGWHGWTLGVAVVAAGASLSWPLWFGRGFQNNQGVIARSLAERDWLQQVGHSAQVYLVEHPLLLLLFVISFIACWPKPLLRGIWLLLLLPMLLAWFIWGSYALRLGLHVVGLAGLLWLHALREKPSTETAGQQAPSLGHGGWLAPALAAGMVVVSLSTAWGALVYAARHQTNLRYGAEVTIRHYFDADTYRVLDIYRSKRPVWVSSNYLNGIFYGNNPVTVPRYGDGGYSREQVLGELIGGGAQYAFSAGIVPYGPASGVLLLVAEACPHVFHEIVHGHNAFNLHVFKVDVPALRSGACQARS